VLSLLSLSSLSPLSLLSPLSSQQHGRQTDYVAKKKNDELMAQKERI
jgi:hypothetical protein